MEVLIARLVALSELAPHTSCPSSLAFLAPGGFVFALASSVDRWLHMCALASTVELWLAAAAGEGKLYAPGNLRATFDNEAYAKLVRIWAGRRGTCAASESMCRSDIPLHPCLGSVHVIVCRRDGWCVVVDSTCSASSHTRSCMFCCPMRCTAASQSVSHTCF